MPGWVVEPTTGKPVYQNDDGTVRLTKFDGSVHDVHPDQVAGLISDDLSGFRASSADDINRNHAQQQWEQADLGTKAGFYAREAVKSAIDSATAIPRAAATVVGAAAEKIGGVPVSNLEALSGENVVEKLDALTSSDEIARQNAEKQRALAEANPTGKTIADVAGFVGGGMALGALGSVGKALSGAGLLGDSSAAARVGSLAIQGGAQGYAAGAEDAWVKDQAYTADAALANMGIGALIGGGFGLAGEGVRAAGRTAKAALAEKLFGGGRLSKEGAEAATQMAEDVTGAKPPEGFAKYFKETLDAVRDKVESVQAAVSGVPKEELQKYGGLRWTEEAISAREAFANRQPILDAVSNDLTESLQSMYSESRPIMEEASRATGKKAMNIAANLTGDTETMMSAARAKASAIGEALGKLDEEAAGESVKSVLGTGEQVADLRDAMESVVKNVEKAESPAEAYNALDEFKARMQRVKDNATASSKRLTSGRQIEQAQERSSFAEQVSNDMQSYLEDTSIWGKQGDVQARINKAWHRALDSDNYISSHLLTRTGEDWGAPRYVVDPGKVQSYVKGLGTAQSKILDGLVKDNLAAKHELAQAIVQGYGLGAHEAGLQKVVDSIKSSQELLQKATDTIGKANIVHEMFQKASSGHGEGLGATALGAVVGGAPGAALGKAVDVLARPDKLMRQAMALREVGLKWQNGISADVKQAFAVRAGQAVESIGKVARAAETTAARVAVTHEERASQYEKIAKSVVLANSDPIQLAQKIGQHVGDVAPMAVRDIMVDRSLQAAQFLNSKLPGPVYGASPLTPNQLNAIAPGQQAKFLRYYAAVNDPGVVFKELRNGMTPAPEHIETLKVCYPALYQKAQQVVMEAVHSDPSGKTLPLQTRISLAELFDVPGQIEPTLDPAFMNRITQIAQQGARQEAQQNAPQARTRTMKTDISKPMQGHLDQLHL